MRAGIYAGDFAESDLRENMKERDRFLQVALGLVFVGWSGWVVWTLSQLKNFDAGTFGDSFGALNALFSGLAFAILIGTIRVQKAELQLQREEMTLQREEMKQSRAELAGQKEQLAKQNKLSVLSARLSVLPTLVAHEITALQSINKELATWANSRPSADEAHGQVATYEQSIAKLGEKIQQLVKEAASLQGGPQINAQYSLARTKEALAHKSAALPHIKRMADYLTDVESIYARLKDLDSTDR